MINPLTIPYSPAMLFSIKQKIAKQDVNPKLQSNYLNFREENLSFQNLTDKTRDLSNRSIPKLTASSLHLESEIDLDYQDDIVAGTSRDRAFSSKKYIVLLVAGTLLAVSIFIYLQVEREKDTLKKN